MRKSKIRVKNSVLRTISYVLLSVGFASIIAGIVFFVISLICTKCKSNFFPSFIDIAIFLITLGIGLSTIAFCLINYIQYELTKIDNESIETANAYHLYQVTISSDEYHYVNNVLKEFYEHHKIKYGSLIENYLSGEKAYAKCSDLLENYFAKIIENGFNKELQDNIDFLHSCPGPTNEDYLSSVFFSSLRKALYAFEEISLKFNSILVDDETFAITIYPTLKETFLTSLPFIYHLQLQKEFRHLTAVVYFTERAN